MDNKPLISVIIPIYNCINYLERSISSLFNQSYSNIDKALEGLVSAIEEFGHHDDLATPLIGTGRAAISGASIEKVAEDIVDKFLDPNKSVSRKLTICINPKDYIDGKVDLKKIVKYIEYKCEFSGRC